MHRAVSVVDHLHPKAVHPACELDRNVQGASMLVSVGQRLLDHPEDGELDGDWRLIDGALSASSLKKRSPSSRTECRASRS